MTYTEKLKIMRTKSWATASNIHTSRPYFRRATGRNGKHYEGCDRRQGGGCKAVPILESRTQRGGNARRSEGVEAAST